MKKVFVVITVLCLLLTSFAGTVSAQASEAKAPPLSMQILGKKVSTASPPIVKNNRIFLPVRAVGEALGYKATWNAQTSTMELKDSKQTLKIKVGSTDAYVNGNKVKLDAAPIMYKERSYMPLTFVQKHFNYTTTYDKTKNIISIDKKTEADKTAAQTQGLYVLGKKIGTDAPVIKNNAVYIPLRHAGEGMGYKVSWYAGPETMEMRLGDNLVKVTVGYGFGVVNGKNVKISPVPIMYNSRLYVPITFIQNNFDYDVSYDKAKNAASIDKKKPPAAEAEEPIEYKKAKIEEIIYDDNGGFPQLNIVADNPVKYKSFTMVNPDRMVVDIENAF